VCLGALAGAFGTVAWLTVLCASSFPQLLLGIAALGAAPVVGGGALLWAGLAMIEKTSARSRVRALPDDSLVEAAEGGATAPAIALRLGLDQTADVEQRLDDLVACDTLSLDVTDQGEVIYKPHREPG
jgi:hypothetical protein